MKITRQRIGVHLELAISGRLDASWAGRLSTELTELIRGGSHHLRLDLQEVDFMSSAGLRVLLQYYKQVKGLGGSLVVSGASAPVKTVMALAGFEELLGGKALPAASAPQDAPPVEQSRVSLLERGGATFEIYESPSPVGLGCRVLGSPDALSTGVIQAQLCRTMQFPVSTLAVGLGAFGHDFEESRGRFGEFLAVAGAVAYHPTDGADAPDYQVQAGAFLPDVQVLDGLICEGPASWLVRFEALPNKRTIPLPDLVESCLAIARTDVAGLVMIAEAAELAGALLPCSPAGEGAEVPGACTVTQADAAKSLALVVGVAAKTDHPSLEAWLHPLGSRSWPTGRFHTAVFPLRPLKKGEIELQPAVSALFATGAPSQVLQLRGGRTGGPGESRFLRGACWIGPIANVLVERVPS
jgi:anti-anti-sigma factor